MAGCSAYSPFAISLLTRLFTFREGKRIRTYPRINTRIYALINNRPRFPNAIARIVRIAKIIRAKTGPPTIAGGRLVPTKKPLLSLCARLAIALAASMVSAAAGRAADWSYRPEQAPTYTGEFGLRFWYESGH